MSKPTRRAAAWTAALMLYCLGIFIESSMSRPPGLAQMERHLSDKVIHGAAFLGMACLAIQTARARWPQRMLNAHLGLGVAFTVAFGISDEVHQIFTPGRSPDVLDAVADAIGACIAAGVIYLLARPRRDPARTV